MLTPQLPPDLPVWQDFTNREREVMMHLADDLSTDQLMARLCIERKSVEKYKTSIGEKLGIAGRDPLNRYARRNRPDLLLRFPILCRKSKAEGGRKLLPDGKFPPPS